MFGLFLSSGRVISNTTPTVVASNVTDVQGKVATAGLRLMGFSARSNAALNNTSKTILRHGTTAADPALAFINLDDDQMSIQWFGPDGIACASGIFVDRDGTNAVEVTLYTRTVT